MRSTLLVVLLTLGSADLAPGAPVPACGPHVRPLTQAAARLLADATAHSPTVRRLVNDLDRSDVIVYLTDSFVNDDGAVRAYLAFRGAGPGVRYLLVRIDRWLIPPWDRVVYLGHELQHAVEVARTPEVRDEATFSQFYRRIGWRSGAGRFETAEAQATGDAVRAQLNSLRR